MKKLLFAGMLSLSVFAAATSSIGEGALAKISGEESTSVSSLDRNTVTKTSTSSTTTTTTTRTTTTSSIEQPISH